MSRGGEGEGDNLGREWGGSDKEGGERQGGVKERNREMEERGE